VIQKREDGKANEAGGSSKNGNTSERNPPTTISDREV
jgi:hypothetical protein